MSRPRAASVDWHLAHLEPEWADRPEHERRAEAERRMRNWQAARHRAQRVGRPKARPAPLRHPSTRRDPGVDEWADRELADYLRRLRPEWHRHAACVGVAVEVFFPVRGQAPTEARTICATCPVREQCLAEALDDPGLDFGIRGGMSPRQRKRMRAARR